MNRFWDSIINPIFNLINPKTIVEIGADSGINTRNILNYCVFNDSKLISIDPSPKFEVNRFKEEYGDKFQMVLDLSLNYIPKLEKCDVILIYGDSNWYTVYNELKLLEKNFDYDSFPLILLHNVSWPYGRRDLYYNPDSIPSGFLHEFKKLGMTPDQSELLLEGGINHNLNNAIADNTPKNGVLTAIEDFLGETELNLSFYKINGFNGLGIMYFEDDSFNEKLNNIFYESEIGETVEKFYISNSIKKNNLINYQKNHILNLETKLSEYEEEIQKLNSLIRLYKEQIDNRNYESENLFEKVNSLQKSNDDLIAKRNSLIDRNVLLSRSKADLVAEKDSLSAKISDLNSINTDLIAEKDSLINRNLILTKSKKELLIENDNLKNQLESLLNSTSWKLTSPLRQTKKIFKK